ncbi:alpha-taxilin-like isoform X1 [Triticum urartu]|uniref:alpha-taxilin-like isoform X1 n=1 Tax=Triticum urartu TaxID=4572 RepID=UPI002042C512|nr:alpha-taxilin-like isoform X1 [Triticum urartu]
MLKVCGSGRVPKGVNRGAELSDGDVRQIRECYEVSSLRSRKTNAFLSLKRTIRKTTKLRLRNKLKDLADQYNIIQQKYAHQLKEKTLELELADLKIQQHQAKAAQEHAQMVLYAEQVSQLVTTEKNLRVQLAADGENFQQFQDALSKSNEVFETYKEMEQMVKAIKDFRKQNEAPKNKCENSDIALVKLIEEHEVMKKQLDKYKNQKDKLESLCRSLQAERKQSPSVSIPNDASNQEDVTSQKQSPSSSIPDDASNQEDVTSQQPEV